MTGLTAAQSISTALLHRERTGEGQYLPISMLDSALYYIWPDVMWSKTLLGEGIDYKPDLFESFPLFKAKDKPISVIVVADSDFQRFCDVIGCKLYEDQKYSTFEQRVLNKQTLIPEIEKYLEDKEADVLCEELDKMGIPVASINQLMRFIKIPKL